MKRRALFLLIVFLIAILSTSCGSISSLVKDPNFQEGFREGWNSTAPEEYRY